LRRFKTLQLAGCAALLCAGLSPSARADNWDRKTIVTFNEAVEIPGQVLPPGTYVFKLVNLRADRNLVQISNEDQTYNVATLETVSTYRWNPLDDAQFRFDERANDAPQALRTRFYPGDSRGVDFIYSHYEYSYPRPTYSARRPFGLCEGTGLPPARERKPRRPFTPT
jgi:hypothetical protein